MVKIHGNWCGPNWTDGKPQPANASGVNFNGKCIDPLDCACRSHDKDCANDLGCSRKGDSKLILEALKVANNPINQIFRKDLSLKASAVASGIALATLTRKR